MSAAPYIQAPWAAAFAGDDGPILYNGLTGRTLPARGPVAAAWAALGQAPQAALPADAQALIDRGLAVPEGADPRALAGPRFPILCRWAAFLHAPGRRPVVAEHPAGTPEPWTPRRLDALETYVWINCRGEVTVDELLRGAEQHVGPEGPAQAWQALRRWLSAEHQLVKLMDAPVHTGLPPHFYALVHDHPRAGEAPFAPADPVTPPLRALLAQPSEPLAGEPYPAALLAALARERLLPAGADVGLPPDLEAGVRARRADLRLHPGPPAAWPEGRLDLALIDQAEDPVAALTQAWRTLAPAGRAWLLVPGDPRPALRAAEAVGYAEADVRPAGAWLGLSETPVLAAPPAQLAALRAVLASSGRPLPLRPWTAAELGVHLAPLNPDWIHHLGFAPANQRILACDTAHLWAVTLRR